MKRILIILAAVVALCSCGASRNAGTASDGNPYSTKKITTDDRQEYPDFYSYLRGKVPGVQVSGTKIIIRGVNSVNSGTDVLVVVDGIKVNDPGSINVEEIESVNVIKDASASIYGFAGANGVIEVRTKGAGRR